MREKTDLSQPLFIDRWVDNAQKDEVAYEKKASKWRTRYLFNGVARLAQIGNGGCFKDAESLS